jgi:hypothetical protein
LRAPQTNGSARIHLSDRVKPGGLQVGYDLQLPSSSEEGVCAILSGMLRGRTECQHLVNGVPVTAKMLRAPVPRTADPKEAEMNVPIESSTLDRCTVWRRAAGASGRNSTTAQ